MLYKIKDSKFFSKSADVLAPLLLGKTICCNLGGETVALIITETEAYCHDDSACYGWGYGGNYGFKKVTDAIYPLFETCGTCCIYGGMILISCSDKGIPDNVLIRAAVDEDEYYDGPCKVASALKADKTLHGKSMTDDSAEIWIENNNTDKRYVAVKRKGLRKTVALNDSENRLRFISI